jgi:hypothetical protein
LITSTIFEVSIAWYSGLASRSACFSWALFMLEKLLEPVAGIDAFFFLGVFHNQ